MAKVVLIGGGGFIGHNIALDLHNKGHDVQIVDSLEINNLKYVSNLPKENLNKRLDLHILKEREDLIREQGIPLLLKDARDEDFLLSLSIEKPDIIIHLAAIAHASRANKNPSLALSHSMRTLENTLVHCSNFIKTKLIFFSSSMVYGDFIYTPADEGHPVNPKSVYGGYKLAGENLVAAFAKTYGFNYAVVRPSALYGPRCISRRIVQIFIENALRGLPLVIQGDGEEELDFTYIKDLSEAILTLVETGQFNNNVYNITYGQGRTINELANLIKDYFPDVKLKYKVRDGSVPIRGELSNKNLLEILGYKPKFSLEDGLLSYINWYKKIPNELYSVHSYGAQIDQVNE